MSDSILEFREVWKTYYRHKGTLLLRSHLKKLFSRDEMEPYEALKNVSFRIKWGESVGIVGSNGAGKSTLLSIVAGLVPPDRGAVAVNGRVAALLELGAGFHMDLTGTENVALNSALLGMTRREFQRSYDEIVEFSELKEFMQEPLRTYSAGMVLRLAFSVATHSVPDILLLDEVLTVGDHAFQMKCLDKIREFRRQGKTILCVSHAHGAIQEFCERAIWLDHGQVMMDGTPSEVVDAYEGRTLGQTDDRATRAAH